MNKCACVLWSIRKGLEKGLEKCLFKSTLTFGTLAVRGFYFKRHLLAFNQM